MTRVDTAGSIVVCGDGVTPEALIKFARHASLLVETSSTSNDRSLILAANVDPERLAHIFEKPLIGCFEVFEEDQAVPEHFVKALSKNEFSFSFSSKTVYQLPVAHHITAFLTKTIGLNDESRDNIEMALHEALVNAVIHGNLEIGHIKKDTLEKLEGFDQEASDRLANPKFAARRVELFVRWTEASVECKVFDQGKGFSIDQDQWEGMPWRGINLISSLASSVQVGTNGQPLIMTFDINQQSKPSPLFDQAEERRASLSLPVTDCRILVVEDSIPIRRVIGAFLKSSNYMNVEFAVDGLEGLEKVASFNPDLVILDIRMPNLDGFGFLRELRSQRRYADLPVLVQTAYTDPEERNKAFLEGGTDLTTKPINGVELLARVKIHLENRMLLRSLRDYRHRLENELSAARKMQEALLPQSQRIEDIENQLDLEIESYFEPSSELGGDFWDIQKLKDHQVAISIVDFSGHGVNSALNTFRLHTLMDQEGLPASDPAAYLSVLNEKLTTLIPRGQFATMFYGVVDTKTDQLTYSAAAAPSPIVGQDKEYDFLEASGMPLGISNKAKYENRTVEFPIGSFLFLYSDALTETEGISYPMLDEQGLGELLGAGLTASSPQHPFAYVLDSFGARVSRPLPDDLTAVWLARK